MDGDTNLNPAPVAPSRVISPSATPALVLGILSLVLGGCFIIGLVLGIIGLVHARKGARELAAYPEYEGAGLITAGRVCSIIGIILGCIQAVFWFAYLGFIIVLLILGSTGIGS